MASSNKSAAGQHDNQSLIDMANLIKNAMRPADGEQSDFGDLVDRIINPETEEALLHVIDDSAITGEASKNLVTDAAMVTSTGNQEQDDMINDMLTSMMTGLAPILQLLDNKVKDALDVVVDDLIKDHQKEDNNNELEDNNDEHQENNN